jgi:hypothetical protein
MRDWIKLDGRPLIEAKYRGSISSTAAKEKAAVEMNTYKERLRLGRETDGELAVGEMLAQARKLIEQKRAKRKKT